MNTWQLQEAKAKFSEVIRQAGKHGPQTITLHGKNVVVVLSQADFERLTQPKEDFVTFLLRSPLRGVNLKITRNKTPARDIDL